MTATPTTAREYLRVSLDKSGRERSLEEQHDDNARAAGEHGWELAEPYRDVGSASRFANGNGRHGFDRLVADLEADRFGASVLVLWEASRGSRRLSEWARFLELCEDAGIRIHVTTHGRTYDPANARDRRSLQEDGTDSEYESAKISARSLRAAAASASKGRPHGRVPYGYRRVYDPATGRLSGQEPESVETAVVREVYDRLERGHSLRSIARDLEARGVRARPPTGRRAGEPPALLSPERLRDLVLHDAYRGKRIHRGELVDAKWDALVTERQWLAVTRRLKDPARRTSKPGRARWLLSMIARCDVCGGPMTVRFRRGQREYRCQDHSHLHVLADELDAYATATMLAYLARPDNVERLTADAGDERLTAVRAEIAGLRAELDDLADQLGRGEISATLAARAEPRIAERLRAAEGREAELATPNVLRGILGPGDDVAHRWDIAPMSARRDVARLLLSPEVIGELRIARAGTPGHRTELDDRVHWRTGDNT
jgi:DNA invertase Pin-like site-specific DNA recombinase